MNSPCMKCADRAVGCHGSCNKYAEYREVCDSIKQKRMDEIITRINPRKQKARCETLRRESRRH